MALFELNTAPTPRQVRVFGTIGMPTTLALVACLAWVRFGAGSLALVLTVAGLLIAGATWATPSVVRGLLVAFHVLTYPLAFALTHVAMGVLFFGILTPLGWVVRLVHGDPLARRRDPSLPTYWTRRERSGPDRYLRPY